MTQEKSTLLATAIEASIAAGKRIMEIYDHESFDVDFKSDNSPLTKADVASHEIIQTFLEKTGIPLLSEEGKEVPFQVRKEWKTLWIVDPIDGTKEFIKKNGEFTVNIALIENQKPVLGVIYVPALEILYFSEKDLGSFKCPSVRHFHALEHFLETGNRLPILEDNRPYTVVASRSHLSPETEAYINKLKIDHPQLETISKGSSLKLCLVAEGKADCYPRFAPTMEWDTAAGQAICEFAGCRVIDWKTNEIMRYNRENLLNNWFLVESVSM